MAVKCTCIEKFRDKQGNIKGYRLQDAQGKCLDITSENLKIEIFAKRFNVVNLKLTTDGRLIDKDIEAINKIEEDKKKIAEIKKKENAFNELYNLIDKNYDPDEEYGVECRRYKTTGTSTMLTVETSEKLFKLMRELGVDIKHLDKIPFLTEIDWYCCGKTDISFWSSSGILLHPEPEKIDMDAVYYGNHGVPDYGKERLKEIIKYLKSDKNMNGISYYTMYETIIAILKNIMSKYRLSKKGYHNIMLDSEGEETYFLITNDVYEAKHNDSLPNNSVRITLNPCTNNYNLSVEYRLNGKFGAIEVIELKNNLNTSKQDLYNLLYNQIEQALKKALNMQ